MQDLEWLENTALPPDAEMYAELCDSKGVFSTDALQEVETAGILRVKKVGLGSEIAKYPIGECAERARFYRVRGASLSGYRGGRAVNIHPRRYSDVPSLAAGGGAG